MLDYKITGDFRGVSHGLVDYLADGYINRDGVIIPCEIGFDECYDYDNDDVVLKPTYIFIKDGITDDGVCYNAETIKL